MQQLISSSFQTAVTEAILVWLLLFNVGILRLLAGFMHWFSPLADKVAEKIGWKAGSLFQKEVAAADAAFGVPGVLAFFVRDNFLVATVIGSSIMLFFMGIIHVLEIKKSRNISP